MKISPLDLVTSEIIGPSSSHTAGVMRIAQKVKQLVKDFSRVNVLLYNSLADTGDAHMTKSAIVAGLLGFSDTDPRVPFSFGYAEDAGLKIKWMHKREESEHPNTMIIEIPSNNHNGTKVNTESNGHSRVFKGISIGGGRIKFQEIKQSNNKKYNKK